VSAEAPQAFSRDSDSRPWPDLQRLLFPRSVAIVGLSEGSGREVVDNVIGRGVEAVGVHPRLRSVRGLECVSSIAELPAAPDLAFMLVGHRSIEAALDAALQAGVRAFVMPGLGNEAGREGAAISRRVAATARAAGAAVVGPNCMGLAVPEAASFWIGTIPPTFLPGHVAAVVQSGSVGEALLAVGPRVGYRCVVSSGGELVTDVADYCAFFAQDDGTRAVGLFLESVRRPDAFASALSLLAEAGKPVACLKVGRSTGGARAVMAHSGAVVGSEIAFSALLRAHGVIEVEDYPELIEVLEVLGRKRLPSGTRIGGVTNSGGEGALLADMADDAGLPFRPLSEPLAARLAGEFPNYIAPQNPIDAWAIETVELVFPGTLKLLAASGEFDILVAQIDQSQFLGEPEVDNAVLTLDALADAVEGKPIFAAITSVQACDAPLRVAELSRRRDIALLRGPRYGMRAIAAAARWKPRRPGQPSIHSIELGDLLRPGALPEHESSSVLERYGIPVARRRRATSAKDAARAASEIGFPVVVKRDGPAHKSKDGGVVLGLQDAAAVEMAATRLGLPVLVAAQVPPGLEVFCGLSRDPEVGPVLVIGLGGAAAEILPGKSACAAPVTVETAREMIASSGTLSKVVPQAAVDAIARVLAAIGDLAVDHPEITAVDVNPLVVGAREAVAVDALVVVENS
jgi:acetate---CoA ligase (ADP-forming)